jgi:serine/threonine protein kinase
MAHSLYNAGLPPDSENYEILGLLGSGGLGAVYRGRARATGEQVVLKTIPVTELSRFLAHEYQILHELDHPNIVRAYDLFQVGDQVFVALEYFEGIDALRALQPPLANNPKGLGRLIVVLTQIFNALKYLHDRQVVHGDFTPENILVDTDLQVKIVDFGLARRLDRDESDLWPPGTMTGSPPYMAPEQVRGDGPQTASDIFALGVIVFKWLYGKCLFEHTKSIGELLRQRVEQRIDADFIRARGASQSVARVLARMLHPDPSKRSGRYAELFTDLRRALLKTERLLRDEMLSRDAGPTLTTQFSAQWDVAISFASNDRAIAKSLAALLKDSGLRVFYDVDHQSVLLGSDLLSVLEEIYSEKSRYCILLVSEHYSKSTWAWLESRHALVRAFAQRTPYLLPIRVDGSDLKGLPKSIAYLDLRENSLEDVAKTIIQKVRS